MIHTVSLVIRSYGEELLSEVLFAIANQVTAASIKEIVIVNTKDGSTAQHLIELPFGPAQIAEIHLPQRHFSYGRALNLGIEHTSGEVIALLSGHSIPATESWLNELITPFAEDAVAGVCGSQIANEKSCLLEKAYRKIWYQIPFVSQHFGVFNATNCAVRRDLWIRRKFDEQLRSCEDRMWARAEKSEGRIFPFAKAAAVYHSHLLSNLATLAGWFSLWRDWYEVMALTTKKSPKALWQQK